MNSVKIQELVSEYFENVSDIDMMYITHAFVYGKPIHPQDSEVPKIISKFLKDNGLETAYINVLHDEKNNPMFFRASLSERDMIDNIKIGLFNDCFNRFKSMLI